MSGAASVLLPWQGENVLQRRWRLTEPLRGYLNFRRELGTLVFSITTLPLGLAVLLAAAFVSRYARRFTAFHLLQKTRAEVRLGVSTE